MAIAPKGRMLALEITPRVIRAAEYAPGTKPVAVTRAAAAERPGGEPVQVARFLRGFLSANGFTAKRAVAAYLGPLIEHRIYAIPPVTGEAREELLRGKIAEEVSTPVAELRVSGEPVGRTLEQGLDRQEVLTVYTPDFEIRRLVFLLVEAGLTPVRVTSVPLALAGLHPADQASALVGFLHVDPSRCVLGITAEGKLRFAREFTVDFSAGREAQGEVPEYGTIDLGGGTSHPAAPAGEDAVAERVVTELTRSLLYFRQLSRGGTISRIYRSGMPLPPAVESLIAARLKIELAPHPAESAVRMADGAAADAAEFGVTLGLAAAEEEPDRVNLLPAEYLLRKKRRADVAAVAAVAAVFLVANAALYLGLRGAERRYREALAGLEATAGRARAMESGLAQVLENRRLLAEAESGERLLASPYTAWRALFASLGAAAPGDVSYVSLAVNRTAHGYAATLSARARGKDPEEVQGRVGAFLSAIRRHGVIADAAYSPVEVRPGGPGERGACVQEFRVTFSLGAGEGRADGG